MLKKLKVSNLAVAESVEVEFVAGLNVITGETGSGKSVIIGALEMLLGSRAEASSVRDGAHEAEVEGDFGDFTVRRTLTAEGRSRTWLDDESVSLTELRERMAGMVDIHGPHANQQILHENYQREALDDFAGLSTKRCEAIYARLSDLKSRRNRLAGQEFDEDAADLLRYQVNELKEADLREEDDNLAERHAAAANAEEVVSVAGEITEGLGGYGGIGDLLEKLRPRLLVAERHFPAAAEWSAKVEEIAGSVEELSLEIARAVRALEIDKGEFEQMEARLGVLNRLKRKYLKGASTKGDATRLLEVLAAKSEKLSVMENREVELARLDGEIEAVLAELKAEAAQLTLARTAAAKTLGEAVTEGLRDLGFIRAEFSIALEPGAPGPYGMDRIIYRFAPNPGEPARALSAIASSGETARVMLALKAALSAHDRTPILIFDEIDANVGGEVGSAVGAKLREVAVGRQVIAITHLPQSAVCGDRHIVVSKHVSAGRTRTQAKAVDGERRVAEIARMLGGEKITSVVNLHARELLERAERCELRISGCGLRRCRVKNDDDIMTI